MFIFSIQTYHRFITIVHSQQPSLRSMSLYIKLILLQWLISPILSLPMTLSKEIVYQPGSFVCQISFSNTSLFIYLFIVSYGIPIIFIIILHICIARYIKKCWKFRRQRRFTGAYIVCPIQRIALIILVLVISYLPYGVFFVLERLHLPVIPYAQKIGMTVASLSFALTMILIFGFNRSVRNSFLLLFHRSDKLLIKHIVYKYKNKSPERLN